MQGRLACLTTSFSPPPALSLCCSTSHPLFFALCPLLSISPYISSLLLALSVLIFSRRFKVFAVISGFFYFHHITIQKLLDFHHSNVFCFFFYFIIHQYKLLIRYSLFPLSDFSAICQLHARSLHTSVYSPLFLVLLLFHTRFSPCATSPYLTHRYFPHPTVQLHPLMSFLIPHLRAHSPSLIKPMPGGNTCVRSNCLYSRLLLACVDHLDKQHSALNSIMSS